MHNLDGFDFDMPFESSRPWEEVNVNGGAIALGHPLGATGARCVATLMHEMARRGVNTGVISMCIGSGMGAAGVFEREA